MNEYSYPILGEERNLPLYVVGIGSNDEKEHKMQKEGFPHFQLIVCTEGEGVVLLDKKENVISKGKAIFLPPETKHKYYKTSDEWKIIWAIFDGREAKSVLEAFDFLKEKVVSIKNLNAVESIFSEIFDTIKQNSYYSGFQTSSMLYNLIIELNKQKVLCSSKNEKIKCVQMKPLVDYMEDNYARDLSLEELSNLLGFSPQYICRLFKECLNARPFEHLARIRITHAKEMLLNTEMAVSSISEAVGYKDCSYFCSVFKRYERISPAEFRTLYKN